MLHEVIITLSGVSGKLLQHLDYAVDMKPFLHPSEIILLDKILAIARNYKYLKDFINANSIPELEAHEDEFQTAPELYIQAFCQGLETVIKPYQNELLKLEEYVLTGPQVTLIYVYSRVDSYSALFSLLMSLVKQSKNPRMSNFTNALYENIMSGVDQAKEALECILKRCHVAFLRKTTNWLINGSLFDSFGEYIIRRTTKETASNESDSVLTYNRDNISNHIRVGEYEIASEFVPLYISYSLVNDILFVGKIVQILNESSNHNYDLNSRHRNLIFGEKEQYFFEKFASLKEIVHDIGECVVKHLYKIKSNVESNEKEKNDRSVSYHLAVYMIVSECFYKSLNQPLCLENLLLSAIRMSTKRVYQRYDVGLEIRETKLNVSTLKDFHESKTIVFLRMILGGLYNVIN